MGDVTFLVAAALEDEGDEAEWEDGERLSADAVPCPMTPRIHPSKACCAWYTVRIDNVCNLGIRFVL
jgi:hypothetical protein